MLGWAGAGLVAGRIKGVGGGGAPRLRGLRGLVASFVSCRLRSKQRHSVSPGRLEGLVDCGPATHTVPAIAGSAGLDLGKLECCWTRRNGMPGRRPLVGWRSLPLKHAGGLVNRPLFLDATVRIFPGHGGPPTSSTVRLQFPQSRAAAIESSRLLFSLIRPHPTLAGTRLGRSPRYR